MAIQGVEKVDLELLELKLNNDNEKLKVKLKRQSIFYQKNS
ncbi:hypothetical protein [Spiroplasma clarkii]|nr:hypothetical protein [Spiroplasma clarkii]